MDQQTVRTLEQELEEVIAGVIVQMGLKKLPLLPSQQTFNLMAKAAVTVYESAVENQERADCGRARLLFPHLYDTDYFIDSMIASFAFRDIDLIANSRFNALPLVASSSW
jgi:hypothetical protein